LKRPAGITLDSVSRHYTTSGGLVRALDRISLEVDGGSGLAVIGPSGCGKSTLLGLLGGLDAPTTGRVVVGNEELSAMAERQRVGVRRRHLGLVFQSDNLLPFLTAVENVAQQVALHGADPDHERCGRLLHDLGLSPDDAAKLPDQMSGGQRQRVAVARALVHRPAVILADEPTGSVDAANAAAILDLLLVAQRDTGATLVVVTHDRAIAGRLDRTVELRDGRLVEEAG
jgi:putative ABC transport system ATP-binding protein